MVQADGAPSWWSKGKGSGLQLREKCVPKHSMFTPFWDFSYCIAEAVMEKEFLPEK